MVGKLGNENSDLVHYHHHDDQNDTVDRPSRGCSTMQTMPDDHLPRDDMGNLVRIDGLEYYRNFFSQEEQKHLLEIVYRNPWQQVIARRQQFYGQVYFHTSQKLKLLQPDEEEGDDREVLPQSLDIEQLLPFLKDRCLPFLETDDFPSQILVNEYRNNLGIASHFEDFESFGPIILTISLINPIYMTLKKPTERTNACDKYLDVRKILLEPGSLLVMKGSARNDYRHGISKYKWIRNLPDGQPDICRDAPYRRVSLTIRHVLSTRRQVKDREDQSDEWRYRYASDQQNSSRPTRLHPMDPRFQQLQQL